MRKTSKYLGCPLPENFFARIGKTHSSQIRRAIHSQWRIKSTHFQGHIRAKLRNFAHLCTQSSSPTLDWEQAFKYAQDWNRYEGYKDDKAYMDNKVKFRQWSVEHCVLSLDTATWLTLASLSFESDAEKESPNHRFLKELFSLYISRFYPTSLIRQEQVLDIYGDQVRCDLIVYDSEIDLQGDLDVKDNRVVVGEMGGVQLWKVMSLIHKGFKVAVMPHWSTQKINPFMRKRLTFNLFCFEENKRKEIMR